ncbi:hypothetical protein H4N58_13560 [Mumia sp. ZJ1417]|uniref:acyl-CoA thioesterase n=1 Tax=Mumia sp. ZJ1417 TaxID=2708082 RepID=UPI00141E17BD|nr:thioesterase family protein [Mumia sp. ZJ1417]QMW65233.1 hypothetical protein H4N58_13560 [Mumia sp. ZJ1417]
MRHLFACDLRWADMDAFGHVNNVTYADYLREARLAAAEAEGARPARVLALEIDYRAPLVFRPEPALVETTMNADGVLVQEIADRHEDGGRTVYARGRTTLVPDGAVPLVRPDPSLTGRLPVTVRARDLGSDGYVDEVATLELLQEARVAYADAIGARDEPWVVGRSETTFLRPFGRRSSCAVYAGIGRLGTSSFVILTELVDEAPDGGSEPVVVASGHNVMVGFDPQTQRSRPLTAHERAHLEPHVVAG